MVQRVEPTDDDNIINYFMTMRDDITLFKRLLYCHTRTPGGQKKKNYYKSYLILKYHSNTLL